MIERDHLVGEIADDQAGVSTAVVVGGVGAHARARDSVFTEADPGSHSALFEGAILLVQVELVRLRVIGDRDVWPSVRVVIQNRDAKALRCRISESGFQRCIFELAVPRVMP